MEFSVLLSLYHKENPDYLYLSLESIANQTLLPNEVVIVFDGEIQNKLIDVVHSFKDKLNLNIVPLTNNVGLGMALNEGLKHCSNEWVFRMDTDDVCVLDRFEKQIKFINEFNNIVLLGTQMFEFKESINNAAYARTVPINYRDIVKFSLLRNSFNHISVLFRKSIVQEVGGYQHHLYMEDYNLWLRIIAKGYQVANLGEPLVYARVGNNMLNRRRGLKYIISEWQLMKLKIDLKLQNRISAFIIFIGRVMN